MLEKEGKKYLAKHLCVRRPELAWRRELVAWEEQEETEENKECWFDWCMPHD